MFAGALLLCAALLIFPEVQPELWVQRLADAREAIQSARYEEAEKLLESAWQQAGDKTHRLGMLYRDLGRAYERTRRYAEAERVYRSALQARERLGPDQPVVASSLADLASSLQAQRRYAEAEALLDRAAGIVEKVAGVRHPAWAYRIGRLADVLADQNKIEEASRNYQRAAQTLAKTLGPETVPLADVLERNGRLLSRTGQVGSEEMLASAATIRAAKSFKDDPSVTPPRLTGRQEPEYSTEARRAGLEGAVVLYLEVDETGVPRRIEVMEPLGMGLDEKAVEAVGRRRQPGDWLPSSVTSG